MKTSSSFVVVIPVSRMDWHLAVPMLWWMGTLSRRQDKFDVVILHSPNLAVDQIAQVSWRRGGAGDQVTVHFREQKDVPQESYFWAPNFVIKQALEMMESDFPGRPMLWVEADCVPMWPGWVQAIEAEYASCGKPFMGDHVLHGQIQHMTGVAVYPPNWRALAPALADCIKDPKWGWDSQAAHQTLPQSARATTIQQVWRPAPFLSSTWRNVVKPETALFHQCKDGSLLRALAEGLDIPVVQQLEKSAYIDQPQVVPLGIANVQILYVTHRKDMKFLRASLTGVRKFASGFSGINVAVPIEQGADFQWVKDMGATLTLFKEDTPKGMLHHEIMVCRADQLCPGAQAILHLDADCIPWAPFTPANYIVNNKPVLYREPYSEVEKHNTNRLFWRTAVQKASGLTPANEYMIRHPAIHLKEVYYFTRKYVEQHTGQHFDDYVLSCQNEFPQGFAEFPLLGAIVERFFDGAYQFVEYDRARDARECGIEHLRHQYIYRKGRDFIAEVWSHGGFDMYEAWINQWLDGRPGVYWAK